MMVGMMMMRKVRVVGVAAHKVVGIVVMLRMGVAFSSCFKSSITMEVRRDRRR